MAKEREHFDDHLYVIMFAILFRICEKTRGCHEVPKRVIGFPEMIKIADFTDNWLSLRVFQG